MSIEISNELTNLIGCLEEFDEQRHHQVKFVKEAFNTGEYLINPKIIATKWLNSCFSAVQEPCIED